jgi:hypothetical protein
MPSWHAVSTPSLQQSLSFEQLLPRSAHALVLVLACDFESSELQPAKGAVRRSSGAKWTNRDDLMESMGVD